MCVLGCEGHDRSMRDKGREDIYDREDITRCLLCCFSTTPSRRMCQWQYDSESMRSLSYARMQVDETCRDMPETATGLVDGRRARWRATHHTHLLNCSGGAQDERREWWYYQRLSSCWFALVLCFRTDCLRALWTLMVKNVPP